MMSLTSPAVGTPKSQKAMALSSHAITIPKAVTGTVIDRVCKKASNFSPTHFVWADYSPLSFDSDKTPALILSTFLFIYFF